MNHQSQVNEIVIRLQGGLGNQLFQYALGTSLAARGVRVTFDRSWFDDQSKRVYELGAFSISIPVAGEETVAWFRRFKPQGGWFSLLGNRRANDSIYRIERSLRFDPAILALTPPVYLDGNWQSEKYFEGIADQIRRNLWPTSKPGVENSTMLAAIKGQTSVAVHVRRGDYVTDAQTNSFHGTASREYYSDAARHLSEHVPKPTFYIFSDDLEWAEDNLSLPGKTILVSQNGVANPAEDLRIMRSCQHHIIANSSLSWWGAWLGETTDQIVIAPKRWFQDPSQDSRDLVPDRWIRM